MAVSKQRRNLAYGVSNPLQSLSPEPIISSRAPKTSDKAELGTIWVYKSTNASYVLASIVANSATWTPLTVNAGATITTGNLTVVVGDIAVTAGDIDLAAGDVNLILGDILVDAGDIEATAGAIEAGTTLIAGTTITSGTGLTVTAGGALISAGNIDVTLGDVLVDAGDIVASAGFIEADTYLLAGSDVTATLGTVRGKQIAATNDLAAGTAGETSFTNIVSGAVSTGAGSIKMTTANPSSSVGFIKIYIGTDIRYIPVFDTTGV